MSQKLKNDPVPGEKVWLRPVSVPVPYETLLRGGVLSGQRGNRFPPHMNKNLTTHRVRKMTGPAEVEWSTWWQRRFVQGDVEFCSAPEKEKAKPKEVKKSGGEK